jgi:hypothetical protein
MKMATFRVALAAFTVNLAAIHAADAGWETAAQRPPRDVRVEVNARGSCKGLRVGDTVVPWMFQQLAPLVDGTSTESVGKTQRVHRFVPEPNGLRWTQTITNTGSSPIAVRSKFLWKMGPGGERPTSIPGGGAGLPLEIGVFAASDVGVSVILPPDEALWNVMDRRLDPGQSITFTALIRVHEADWRPGVAWVAREYPEYMNPPNPRVHQIVGGGAYSSSWDIPAPAASLAMGFRFNWKASFDFPAMGMFVAPSPVDVNTTWKDIRGRDT